MPLTLPLSRQGSQDFSAFFVFGMLSGLWLVVSNIYRRRLIINHIKANYQFFIKGRLWHEGPMHQIYVRLVAQRDGKGAPDSPSRPSPERDSLSPSCTCLFLLVSSGLASRSQV